MCNKFRTSSLMLSLLVTVSCLSSPSAYGVTIDSSTGTERNITISLRRLKTDAELDTERTARSGFDLPIAYIRTPVPGATQGECFECPDTSNSFWFKHYVTQKTIAPGQCVIRNEKMEEEVLSTQGNETPMTVLFYPGEYGGPNEQMTFSTGVEAIDFLRNGHIKIFPDNGIKAMGSSHETIRTIRF